MNNRQLSILHLLLQQEEPISAKQVGNNLGLSAHSIRYNLDPLREWLSEYGIPLENKPNWGLFIPVTSNQRVALLMKIRNNYEHELYLKQSNRCLWIEFELLNQESPCKGKKFQYTLGISHNTCTKDLQVIDERLADWGLTLKRTTGLGTEVCGPELKYRYRFISLIRSIVDENDLIKLCLWNKVTIDEPHLEQNIVKAKIIERIRKWNLRDAWMLLRQLSLKSNFTFTDMELVRLSLYISISCRRISINHTLQLPLERINESKQSRIYTELKSILPSWGVINSRFVSEAEIAQLAIEISTVKRSTSISDSKNSGFDEMIPIAKEILEFAGKELGCNLVIPKVLKMLSQHISLSMTRIEHELPLFNPILDDIVKNYSSTLDIVKRAVSKCQKLATVNLPLSELGYIALYVEMAKIEAGISNEKRRKRVIVVCPTGGITVGMLLLRIKNELPIIDVVDVLSIREFNTKDIGSDIDAVITTSPSLVHNKLKVICVSPLLDKENVVAIVNQLKLGEDNE